MIRFQAKPAEAEILQSELAAKRMPKRDRLIKATDPGRRFVVGSCRR